MATTSLAEMSSFKQLQFCSMCRQSHDQGKRHVYSKRHRTTVQKILDKFGKKVEECLKSLTEPRVASVTAVNKNELLNQFWCHFCNGDQSCHQIQGQITIYFAGMIEHLTSESHIKKMKLFWFLHRLDTTLQAKFIFTEDSVKTYWEKVDEIKEHFLEHKSNAILMDSARIHVVEQLRTEVVDSAPNEVVKVVNGPGTLPPWLMDDDTGVSSNSRPIGPTMQDWQRHLENIRKRKLPAQRVGAGFDRHSAVSSTWLPSFGRVWNHSRRLQSRREFNSETYSRRKKRKCN